MTETRLKELQTEIANLKQIDKETNERVAAEFFERDIVELSICAGDDTMGSFDENGDAMEFINSGGDPLELNQSILNFKAHLPLDLDTGKRQQSQLLR